MFKMWNNSLYHKYLVYPNIPVGVQVQGTVHTHSIKIYHVYNVYVINLFYTRSSVLFTGILI